MVDQPTAEELKTRYPEFDGVADVLVTALIGEAGNMVDDEWVTTDQKPALMALAAHLMSQEGYPKRGSGTNFNAQTAGREVLSRKVGDVSTQYAQSASSDASAGGIMATLNSTAYGRRFAQLLKLNSTAIGLV